MNKTLRHCSVHVRAFCLQPRAPIGLDLPSTRPHLSPPFSASPSLSANHTHSSRAGVGPAQKCVLRPWRRPGSPSMTDNFRSSASCEEKVWLGEGPSGHSFDYTLNVTLRFSFPITPFRCVKLSTLRKKTIRTLSLRRTERLAFSIKSRRHNPCS
ncbi:hypothetical protein BJX65DRAFT_194778 [Aspergillus insuetus]